MPKLDFSKLTPSAKEVESLKDLIQFTAFEDENLEKFMTFIGTAQHGKKVGFIGEMEDVGVKGTGCNPTYKPATIASSEKTWDIGEWQIPLSLCYKELEGTIAEYCLKSGTEIGDLTSTEYMQYVARPALEKAMMKMMWRFAWFGDKDAQSVSSGGVIKDGVNVELFKTCDGLFKRLFAITTEHENQKTTIAANEQATYALQKSKLLEAGVATGIFDDMLLNADSRITSNGGAFIVTDSLAKALAYDMKKTYKEIMPWTVLSDGLEVSTYGGVPVLKVALWDRFINAYQNNGTKLNIPHRAVLSSVGNLLIGAPQNDLISDLDIWFDRKDRQNYFYSAGKLGSMVLEDELIHMAY